MSGNLLLFIPAGTAPAKCRSCAAPIYWVKTRSGKNMPVSIGGPGCYAPEEYAAGLGISHFADCEFAADHRRGA